MDNNLDINTAIQHCLDIAKQCDLYKVEIEYKCGEEHRRIADWLMELKDLRGAQDDQYVFIRDLMDELKEVKNLLKLAMEDIYKARQGFGCAICDMPKDSIERCDVDNVSKDCKFVWKYTNEAKKLLGEEV